MNDNELDIKKDAYPWAIKVAGSILVLSISLKVIGVDFTPVMQALTASIAQSIEHKGYTELEHRIAELEYALANAPVPEYEYRIIELERLTHPPTKKANE